MRIIGAFLGRRMAEAAGNNREITIFLTVAGILIFIMALTWFILFVFF
jgi:hypothetical protein